MPIQGRLGSAIFGILTVTERERDAVQTRFGLTCELDGGYYKSPLDDPADPYRIVHRRMSGQTNLISAQESGDMIEDFKPEFLLLLGTAGGHSLRDHICLGDVLIANYIDNSNYWKYSKGKVVHRRLPHDHPSSHLLTNHVEPLTTISNWSDSIQARRPSAGSSKAILGSLVSGDRLFGDPENREQKFVIDFFDKACAFEMEAFGVSSAVYRARRSVHYNPQFLVIRGISDLVNQTENDNQQDRDDWTPYAASAAAHFALLLINRVLESRGLDIIPW